MEDHLGPGAVRPVPGDRGAAKFRPRAAGSHRARVAERQAPGGWPLVSRNEVPTIDAEAGELLCPQANGQCFRIRGSELDDLGSDDPPCVVRAASGRVEVGVPAFMPPPAMTAMQFGVAVQDIPPEYQTLITRWAGAYGIDWSVLAGVLKGECDFGPNCGTSAAGAVGPAQFEPGTWAVYGVDGDGDGRRDPLDPADAVASAAKYLHALGAGIPTSLRAALCHYNAGASPAFQACMDATQQPNYADSVLGWAARYRVSQEIGRAHV